MREAEELAAMVAGELGMPDCLLGRLRPLLELAPKVRDAEAERIPDVHEAFVVSGLLEQGQGRVCECVEFIDRGFLSPQATVARNHARHGRLRCVIGCACPLGGRVGDRSGVA